VAGRSPHVVFSIPNHDGSCWIDVFDLNDVRDQIAFVVEPAPKLRAIQGIKMPAEVEMLNDAPGEWKRFGRAQEHSSRERSQLGECLGYSLVDFGIEDAAGRIVLAIKPDGFFKVMLRTEKFWK
jgi:hypothetical protein